MHRVSVVITGDVIFQARFIFVTFMKVGMSNPTWKAVRATHL